MAKNRKKTAVILPAPGEAFLMPLADGRFGVCRVLRHSSAAELKYQGVLSALVAPSTWIGAEPPDIDDPQLGAILLLNHHAWKNDPAILWVSEPVPESFRRLGRIEPSETEKQMPCAASGGWGTFPLQLHLQWRWDHDREAVLKEDEIKNQEKARQYEEMLAKEAECKAGLKLQRLMKKKRFAEWKKHVAVEWVVECEEVFRATVDALIKLGAPPKKRPVLAVLKQCVEALNELDRRHDHFITTVEAEDLCREFDDLAAAVGLTDSEGLADRWRAW